MRGFQAPDVKDYTQRLVAFVDVLGFEALVEQVDAEKVPFDQIASLLGFMKETEETLQDSHFKNVLSSLEVSAMSDSLIISAQFEPKRTQSILDFLYYIKSLQIRFLGDHQTLTRGFLCAGKMYHHNNVIFGKPYMKAYRCEKSVGGAKIVIDPELEDLIVKADQETEFTDAKELTRRDKDGWRFVNYLQDPNLPSANTFPYSYALPKITEFLWDQLSTQRDRVLEKYRWLSGYMDELTFENKCPAAELTTLAFPQNYSLTTTLQQSAGKTVYFQVNEKPYPEYFLLDVHFPAATLLTSALVPEECLDDSYDIRPDRLSVVKKFLIDLGAYPAEAEKIISKKSGKTAKMKKESAPDDSQREGQPELKGES